MVNVLPKISVVTTSFNQAHYLEQAILSVLEQGYPELEYIVIDGGSTDGSIDIIKKYAHRLTYWVSEPDGGMYEGIQKGLSRCTGDIMAWINSDDLFQPYAFQIAAEVFVKFPHVQWLQGIPTVIDEKGRIVYVRNFRKWSKYNYFLGDKEHIQQESTFWTRQLWAKAGGRIDTTLKLAGDYELWSRFFEHAELHCIQAILGSFRARSSNQLSLDKEQEYNAEVKQVLAGRLSRLTAEERKILDAIKSGDKSQSKSFFGKPGVPSIKLADTFPPALIFDRVVQEYVMV